MKILSFFLFFHLLYSSFERLIIPVSKKHVISNISQEEALNIENSSFPSFLSAVLPQSPNSHFYNTTIRNSKDIFYYGEILVGKEGKSYTIIFDTGSNNFWLPTEKCTQCPAKNRIYCEKSESCFQTTQSVEIKYGKGYVKGTKGSELIGLTSNQLVNSSIFLIDEGKDLQDYYLFDGIMGLGNRESANDFIDLAYEAGYIEEKIFSFYLDHNSDNTGNIVTKSSFLSIGFIPENQVNKIAWVPVTSPARWVTDVIELRVGNETLDIGFESVAQEVLIDSGTSFSVLPPSVIQALEKQLKDTKSYTINQTSFWPCEDEDLRQYPNVTYYTRGIAFNLTAREYFLLNSARKFDGKKHCHTAILSTKITGVQILGDNFMRNSFVTFSKRNQTMGIYVPDMTLLTPIPNSHNFYTNIFGLIVLLFAWIIAKNKYGSFSSKGVHQRTQTLPLLQTKYQSDTPIAL